MEPELPKAGRAEFGAQGFVVHWDDAGLRIEVTDYHAKILRLKWKDVLKMAEAAGRRIGPEDRDH